MWYIRQVVSVVFRHTPSWYLSLSFTYLGGYGLFASYAEWRAIYNHWAMGRMMPLPEQLSIWLIATPLIIWLLLSLVHKEVMRRKIAPRLMFSDVSIETSELRDLKNGNHVDTIYLFHTAVKNCPLSNEDGRAVSNAFINVAFFRNGNEPAEKSFDYARWTDNPKPRSDERDHPKFIDPWNFRDIEPNGAQNGIDFAIIGKKTNRIIGFRGRSQNRADWQDYTLSLLGDEYLVRLTVSGSGLPETVQEWFIIKNDHEKNLMFASKISPESYKNWKEHKNWIGMG